MAPLWASAALASALVLLGSAAVPLLRLQGEALGQPEVRSFAPPGLEVSGLAFDGQSLWVTVDGGRGIHAVDPESGRIRRSLPFSVRDTAGSAWDGRLLWQLAYEQKLLLAIDPATGAVVRRMRSPGQGMCSGMTYDGHHLWVANFEDRKLYRIDQRGDGRVLRALPTEQETCGIAWDGRRLWAGVILGVSDHGAPTPQTGFVYERDLDSGQILRVLHVAGVGPGTSDWPWGPAGRRRFWWYDGHVKRIVWYDLPLARAAPLALPAPVQLTLAALALACGLLAWRSAVGRTRP